MSFFLNEINWACFLLVVFSLIIVILISYFKFGNNSFESTAPLLEFLNSTKFFNNFNSAEKSSVDLNENSAKKYSTFKMTSFERKQSFIKGSLEERRKKHQAAENDTFTSIFSFTKTLMNYNKSFRVSKKNQDKNQFSTDISQKNENFQNLTQNQIKDNNFETNSLCNEPISKNIIKKQKLSPNKKINDLTVMKKGFNKSVSLQIGDELKMRPDRSLVHQVSSSSSNSSTPADLFSLAEKGRINSSCNKSKSLKYNKNNQKPSFSELVFQIQNHEDAINREYLLHQLNPSQYHSMHFYKRLEKQNSENSNKKILTSQDTIQSNSSTQTQENNKDSEKNFISGSSSNSSCSECGSLDTEEELTLPFMKKSHHHQLNFSSRSKQPLKLSSSLDKTKAAFNLNKQNSNDSNEAMVGLLNENLIKRQFANGTYLKLNEKGKKYLSYRLAGQNSFSGSSFNNSSYNSSFDHDDMLVQFTNHQPNSFSSTDTNNANYNYENNSFHSTDSSSSSNSSFGHPHVDCKKTFVKEFKSLSFCDNINLIQKEDKEDIKKENFNKNSISVSHAYDPATRKLKIRILKADYVPRKSNLGWDRCFIKLILLPYKKQKFKTSIKSCSSSSIDFDELFTFNRISPENIMSLSIKYVFYLVNNESKYKNMDEAVINFENNKPMQQENHIVLKLNTLNSNLEYYQKKNKLNKATANDSLSDISSILRSDSGESNHSVQLNLPELLIGLAYNATTGRLQVSIIRGSQFKVKSNNKPPDTYVKCVLLSSAGREIGRNKTTVKRAQPNPVFKQTFAFQVALFQLPDVSLMISVYNKKSMKRKEMIGWFSLGCNSTGEEENSHWNEMRDGKGEQISRWHILTDS